MYSAEWIGGLPAITILKTVDPASNKLQSLHLKFDLAGVDPATVRRVQILASFDFALKETVDLQMVGLLQAVVETPSGAGKVLLSGNLEFVQN